MTMPDADPPAELKVATVLDGRAPWWGPRDSVSVQYQGVNWTSGEVFDQS